MIFDGVPIENIARDLVFKARPGMLEAPEGHRLISQGMNNTALSYDERAELVRAGQENLHESRDSEKDFRTGQGILMGLLGASSIPRAAGFLGEIGAGLEGHRTRGVLRSLDKAVMAMSEKDKKVPSLLTRKVYDAAGQSSPGSGAHKGRVLSVEQMIQGPLKAREGNSTVARGVLSDLIADVAKSRGITATNTPELGTALRRAGVRRSLWDQVSTKLTRGAQNARRISRNPITRLALTAGGIGIGAQAGASSIKDLPEVQDTEELVNTLKALDMQRSASPPSVPPELQSSLSGLQKYLPAPSAQSRKAALASAGLETLLGGPMLSFDEAMASSDPAWGLQYEGLG